MVHYHSVVILGIDPGSKATGLAVLAGSTLLHYEALNLDNLTEDQTRSHLFILKHKYGITDVCMENQPSGGRGHAATWASKHLKRCLRFANYPKPHELYPQEWRQLLKLFTRKASGDLKQQSIEFVKDAYEVELSHDVAEAVCIASAYQVRFLNGQI